MFENADGPILRICSELSHADLMSENFGSEAKRHKRDWKNVS